MTAQDYVDWTDISGLYLGNESHLARYRAYQQQLSTAGLHVVVVFDFLKEHQGELHAADWRTYSVYEPGSQQEERIRLTATALDGVGAPRIAEAVRTAKSLNPLDSLLESTPDFSQGPGHILEQINPAEMMAHLRESMSRMLPQLGPEMGGLLGQLAGLQKPAEQPQTPPVPPAHETKAELTSLLNEYVTRHAATLQEDLKRHGDPRQQPGYTKKKRQQELDELRRQQFEVADQRQEIEQLREYVTTIQKKVQKATETTTETRKKEINIESLRRKVKAIIRTQRAKDSAVLLPEMQQALSDAEACLKSLPKKFQEKQFVSPELAPKLEAIGPFEANQSENNIEVVWRNPPKLKCKWAKFELTCSVPEGQDQLAELVLDHLHSRFKELTEDWKQQLLDSFYDTYLVQLSDWEIEDYELDDEERPTEEGVLSKVNGGWIRLEIDAENPQFIDGSVFFSVEWDEEHGFEIEWSEELTAPVKQGKKAGKAKPVEVSFTGSGPVLTAAEIIQFEQQHKRELPEEYRQFLIQHNGGVPQPNHLVLKSQGQTQTADILQFLPLCGADSVETELSNPNGLKWPKSLLPIARIEVPDHTGQSITGWVLLVLSGKKLGRVLLFVMGVLGGRQELFQNMLNFLGERPEGTGCASLSDLLARLQTKPVVKTPEWLEAIRQGDAARFRAWLDAGGNLKESHQEYGTMMPIAALDAVVKDAPLEFVQEVINRKLVKPKQLRESWQMWSRKAARWYALFPVLPKDVWSAVWRAEDIWDHPEIWESFAESGFDSNGSLDDEGATALHYAVQAGSIPGVKWLMAHGADPHKHDKYQRNAFVWAEHGGGYECLPYLRGEAGPPQPTRAPLPNVPAIEELWQAAQQLPEGTDLQLQIQIKGPATTRVEKAYGTGFHYVLTMGVRNPQVVVKDAITPRQYYLQAGHWPNSLFAPCLEWPELSPLWDTLKVQEFDWGKALKQRKYAPLERPELIAAARAALEQGFDSEEALAREIRLSK